MSPLQLVKATLEHLLRMGSWFPSQDSCRVWGGPEFRFPCVPYPEEGLAIPNSDYVVAS